MTKARGQRQLTAESCVTMQTAGCGTGPTEEGYRGVGLPHFFMSPALLTA